MKIFFSLCAAVSLAGCATFPDETDFVRCDFMAEPLLPVLSQTGSASMRAENEALFAEIIGTSAECDAASKYFDVLAISGGGADGAYGAGFLSTWIGKHNSKNDDSTLRPCLITGISTGAIMAPYVYLATSSDASLTKTYLEKLENLYLGLSDDVLVEKNEPPALLFESSVYRVGGIKRMLAERVDEQLLKAIKEEYRKTNRQLVLGATNLYTGEFEVINVTGYLEKHDPAKIETRMCVAEAIRASAAIPVIFPPVPLVDSTKKEGKPIKKLYSDGGVRHLIFLNANLLEKLAGNRTARVYGVINNTFSLAPSKDRMSIIDLAGRNTSIAMDQLYREAAHSLDRAASDMKALRYWTYPPENSNCDARKVNKEVLFDPVYQGCLFDLGKQEAACDRWTRPLPAKPTDVSSEVAK